jgi:hypothetical protein
LQVSTAARAETPIRIAQRVPCRRLQRRSPYYFPSSSLGSIAPHLSARSSLRLRSPASPRCASSTPQPQKNCQALISSDFPALASATPLQPCRCAAVSRASTPSHHTPPGRLLQLLLESQQWANEIDLPNLSCPWTTAPASADLRIVGFDQQHRPVIYSSMLMVIILLLLPCRRLFPLLFVTVFLSATRPCAPRTRRSSTPPASWPRLRRAPATAAPQAAHGSIISTAFPCLISTPCLR